MFWHVSQSLEFDFFLRKFLLLRHFWEDLWEGGTSMLHSPPAATSENSNFRPPAWLAQWPLPLVISDYEINIALYLVILPTL